MKTLLHADFLELLRAQGVPKEHLAFKCPACGTIQSPFDLIAAGAGPDFKSVEGFMAFSCVGRWTHRKPPPAVKGTQVGCNWTLGGLFHIHELLVQFPDGTKQMAFEPATPDEAQAHKDRNK